jgi:hypothetical protein
MAILEIHWILGFLSNPKMDIEALLNTGYLDNPKWLF